MAEPIERPPAAPPSERGRLPVLAICVVNVILALSELVSRQLPNPPPQSGVPPFPAWFRGFLDAHGAILLAGVVGLLLMRRWGFWLTLVAYFGLVLALVLARMPWVCAAAMQFPLFAILSLQWKSLR